MPNAPTFKDHFSLQAADYSQFRPRYPLELFDYLASVAPAHKSVWDVGTGNGQAATELAQRFEKVIATDPSKQQIAEASPRRNIEYRVCPAEKPTLGDEKFDLITVAQAVHWFQFDEFYRRVKEHASPNAVLALWTYTLAQIHPTIDSIVENYYAKTLQSFWPPERHWVDEEYKTLPFPFRELTPPALEIVEPRTLSQWVGYLYTWSATQNYLRAGGEKGFETLITELAAVWGPPDVPRVVRWPIFLRVGQI